MNGKSAMFIDGANIWATTKALDFQVDFSKLLKYVSDTYGTVLRAHYYTALMSDINPDIEDFLRPLLDYLEYNGYSVVTKNAKAFVNSETGQTKVKGNMDIELSVDAMELVFSGNVETVLLFSGDGDFTKLVAAMQRRGARVLVASTIKTNPAYIADELRRQADGFIDLAHIKKYICREYPARDKISALRNR